MRVLLFINTGYLPRAELSFPEGAKITGLEFPDEDWWFGHYNGHAGLFPANYVERDP